MSVATQRPPWGSTCCGDSSLLLHTYYALPIRKSRETTDPLRLSPWELGTYNLSDSVQVKALCFPVLHSPYVLYDTGIP